MNLPSGLVFYLDFQYGTAKAPFTQGSSLYGTRGADATDPFGNSDSGGLYGSGRFGYSINNTASVILAAGLVTQSANWFNDAFADDAVSASIASGDLVLAKVAKAQLNANYDTEAIKSFYFIGSNAPSIANQYPAYTSASGTNIHFIVAKDSIDPAANTAMSYSLQPTDADRGDFEDGNSNLNTNFNNPIAIPEINVQMRSEAIVAKTRKLKAVWTPEFAQDLNAYHSLDAEAELTSIMSEYISLEIDQEILSMLIESAAAGKEYWSAENNVSLDNSGVLNSNLGFYNSQGQWFQTLGTKIQKLSNIIHQKTLRGGANFLVCSPTVATIIESIPGFASNSDGDAAKMSYAFGVQKAGAITGRYQVYKNPYMKTNQVLLGYRGGQFLEAGAVFAPYIPLIMTPLVYDPSTFTPRKGLLTRYAKKVVRPEFYGIINVSGLNSL